MLTLYQVHSCFLKLFEINIFSSHSNHPFSLLFELINQFLYKRGIGLKLIKIQFCEAKMSVMRVRSRTIAKSKMEIFVKNFLRIETVKNSHRQLHFRCHRGPRSRLSRLIIDIVVPCNNQNAAQSGLKYIIQMLQKKMRNNYEQLKYNSKCTEETSFMVCMLSNSGKGKAENTFYQREHK